MLSLRFIAVLLLFSLSAMIGLNNLVDGHGHNDDTQQSHIIHTRRAVPHGAHEQALVGMNKALDGMENMAAIGESNEAAAALSGVFRVVRQVKDNRRCQRCPCHIHFCHNCPNCNGKK
uniref:Uncharacterized protein n=1 Tax=Globodera rostochiensis TaxID=31243 RepID=A0A914HP17_GLORO